MAKISAMLSAKFNRITVNGRISTIHS